MTPLIFAIEQMDQVAAEALLRAGVNANESDDSLQGARPLHISVDIECEVACREQDAGNANAVPISTLTALLLQFGADPTLRDSNGQSAIDWARQRNHLNALSLFDSRKA